MIPATVRYRSPSRRAPSFTCVPRLDLFRTLVLELLHNGEAVSPEVLSKIKAAGGSVTSSAWQVDESGPDGVFLSDEAVDWIETAANDESD